METKYSKTEFEGYTHRFKVEFETKDLERRSIDIYSNSGEYIDLQEFINESKNENVVYFTIINRTTKEQDKLSYEFIKEILSNL